MRTFAVALTTVLALGATAAPAFAKNDKEKKDPPGQSQGPSNNGPTVFTMTPCAPAGVQIAATGCVGWLQGNLNAEGLGNGTLDERTERAAALNELMGASTFDAATLVPLSKYDTNGPTINFGQTLYGLTVVGFHVGGAGGGGGIGYSGTAFYKFDAGATGINSFNFQMPGLSNAALYSTGNFSQAVPEPATWAMMIMGFGAAGSLLRRRRAALA